MRSTLEPVPGSRPQVKYHLGCPVLMSEPAAELRVMIVEDDSRTRGALAAYISGLEGMSIIGQALDGLEAIELIQDQVPDIVLMDVRMPRMGGIQATRILKEQWPQVKVVILTIDPGCLAEATSAGADAFLLKGCSVDEMVSIMRSVVVD
jgi:DNA-binding NarL/FixJ family response regulator